MAGTPPPPPPPPPAGPAPARGRAPPPLRAENLSFTHVINPFDPGSDAEHQRAQLSSMHSIAHAAALAQAQGILVDVVCAMFVSDVESVNPMSYGFSVAILNVSTVTTLPQFKHPVRLP